MHVFEQFIEKIKNSKQLTIQISLVFDEIMCDKERSGIEC